MLVSVKELETAAKVGLKTELAALLCKRGIDCAAYTGVVPFSYFPLESMEGLVCDAAAVRLPEKTKDIPRILTDKHYMSYGVYIHLGSPHYMTWAHIDNVSGEDMIRIKDAVIEACSESNKTSIVNRIISK